jgi:hypothetical protein
MGSLHRVSDRAIKQLPVVPYHGQSPIGIDLIAFVEGDLNGPPTLAQQLDNEGIPTARGLGTIQQQQHEIHLANGRAGTAHQTLPQEMVRLVDPRRVQKHNLGPRGGENAPQPMAGGLGHSGGDSHLGTDQLIEECGFTHVRSPDQGHEARTEFIGAGNRESGIHILNIDSPLGCRPDQHTPGNP